MSSLLLHPSSVRWKEWIPFVTQQQRFRNVNQIIGYNIGYQSGSCVLGDVSFYYTLHLSTMCPPFYTSEPVSNQHPKWSEINLEIIDPSYGSATGLVVRIWERCNGTDSLVSVWGIYFSGLANITPNIMSLGKEAFLANTLVFCMHGGFFTSNECFKTDEPTPARITEMSFTSNDVQRSYSVESLRRLHYAQRSIKEFTEDAMELHKKITRGRFPDDTSQIKENSAVIRRLLNQNKPAKVSHQQILSIKREIELKKFEIQLLQEQKLKLVSDIKESKEKRAALLESNKNEDQKLKDCFETMDSNIEKFDDYRTSFVEKREIMTAVTSQFSFRQHQLISELASIFPMKKVSEDKYTICDVHLPNSEDFNGVDELSLSVALGFTAHLVQLISFIINIPLRYRVDLFGSRSKIVDAITDQIPDKDRVFPLFVKGKDRQQFDYAVYLLNKNIAQLRWYCGVSTSDLRNTLPNLETLLNLHSTQKSFRNEVMFLSEDLWTSSISRNFSPYSSIPNHVAHYDVVNQSNPSGDCKNRSLNTSENLRQEDELSSDSVEFDATHNMYISTPLPKIL